MPIENQNCDLRATDVEDYNYVLLQCCFAKECWRSLETIIGEQIKPASLLDLDQAISQSVVHKQLQLVTVYVPWYL